MHRTILSWFIIITMPLLTLLAGTFLFAYDARFYTQQLSAVSLADKGLLIENTVHFLQGEEQLLFFSPREREHLADVRGLLDSLFALFIILLVVDIAFFLIVRDSRHLLWIGGIAGLLGTGIIALLAAPFSWFFTAFHGLFFAPGSWVFPADSALVQLFPSWFFQAALAHILAASAFMGIMLLLFSRWFRR
ncbi:MAG TPA: DUF1461 domain-containing protein [Candidatus Nanoarchaeia archaeon]|nr:DUF1461 domain-containing protein [Candidatus Nanoarchaeia archaeon]